MPVLKWRDVVSFSGHVLRPWAHYVGRCLQILISELCAKGIGLGFQNLRGVRDQMGAFDMLPPKFGGARNSPVPLRDGHGRHFLGDSIRRGARGNHVGYQ